MSVVERLVMIAALLLAAWLFLPHILNLFGIGNAGGPRGDGDSTSLQKLATLEVVAAGEYGEAPPYSRDQFGAGWADLDGDNCNTRNEILSRDLDDISYQPNTGNCVVESGILQDPYTGQVIHFQRGPNTSQAVQIDHVVALADGWRAGAWRWDADTRLNFANDPLNLLAVDGPANQRKGADTADAWLPDDPSYHCQYAARQVAVKHKWDLSVTAAEQSALNAVLQGCPDILFTE